MACAFCIIPSVRGKSRSRTAAELCAEVADLVRHGHREIVLCGIHIGHWGRERGETLADLVRALSDLDVRDEGGCSIDFRVRLSSIEATEVTDPLVELMAARPERIAPHLHMPMQAGDDDVLRAMNRWYTVREYLDACDRIRTRLDRPAFTADVLVGFPGETAAAFQNTLETVRRAGFARVHAFPFSHRPGTAAAHLAPVPPEEMRARRAELSETAADIGRAFRRSLVGATEHIVLEGSAGLSGRYQRVRVPLDDDADRRGAIVPVRLEGHEKEQDGETTFELVGRPLSTEVCA